EAFLANPEEAPYQPVQGAVVTYDAPLTATFTPGEGEEDPGSYSYTVTGLDGSPGDSQLYNLVLIRAEQLIENTNEETALDRYRARVIEIREQLTQLTARQQLLLDTLRERAGREPQFSM
ncbi:MAG: hypothetical protein KC561_09435, partial [Myxococcales bacterium]|nr:hypothetical protein [Myxococcales bacterium]